MPNPLRVPYAAANASGGEAGLLPFLPITLTHQSHTITAPGLVDTGATVNVLPYALGLALGRLVRLRHHQRPHRLGNGFRP